MIWTLLPELFLKSALVAGAALLLVALLRFRPAADRVLILRAAVCLLIALPAVAAFGPELRVSTPLAARAAPILDGSAAAAAPARPAWSGEVTPVQGLTLSGSIGYPSPAALLGALYVLGGLLVLGRFAAGLWTLGRWTAQGRTVRDPAWTEPLRRLKGPGRAPRLVASPAAPAPLSWGLPPGVILIGARQLARPQEASAVLAHELAHLRRGDWLFLALSRVALALFWFNPLVWRLHADLAAATEDAADAAALRHVDRQTYARVLLSLASTLTPQGAVGMTGPARSLKTRIKRIMTTPRNAPSRPLALAAAVAALIAIATPIAAVQLTPPAPPAPAFLAAPIPPAPAAPPAPLAPVLASLDAPLPPMAPLPPAPPAPPALPASLQGGHVVIHDEEVWVNGERRRLTEEERAEIRATVAEARRTADAARAQAEEARAHAREARARAAEMAREHRAEAVAHAQAAAAEARVHAAHAREAARVHMAGAADQMIAGAQEMRRSADRLRDPAFRAEQIRENAARGNTVTDEELRALIPRLTEQAAEMEAQAERLRSRGV